MTRGNDRDSGSRWQRGLCAMALACACGLSPGPVAAQPAIEVIEAPGQQAEADIDRRTLLSIYIGRVTSWPDGKPIRVFALADDDPLHIQFCRQLLGTYPYVLRNAWDKLVYTGTGFAPTIVSSEAEMRKRVADTPGAIGYVSLKGQGSMLERFSASLLYAEGGV